MISQALLNKESKLLTEVLQSRCNSISKGNKPEMVNVTAHDFFDIAYEISNPNDDRYKIRIAMKFPLLEKFGDSINQYLKDYFGDILSFEDGFSAVLTYTLISPLPEKYAEEIKKAQFLKRTCIYGIVSEYFNAYKKKSPKPDLIVNTGRNDKLYLITNNGLVFIYSLVNYDPAQFLFVKNFAQEFKNIQKYNTMGPITTYSESTPPPELEKHKLKPNDNTCYISFFFDDRFTKDSGADVVTNLITLLPMQIYYSIANYNTFFISRLREQSVTLIKYINRSRYDTDTQKTIKGRTS